jgi:hypothetical protein
VSHPAVSATARRRRRPAAPTKRLAPGALLSADDYASTVEMPHPAAGWCLWVRDSATSGCRRLVDAAVTVPSRFQRFSAVMRWSFRQTTALQLCQDVCGAGTLAHRLCLLRCQSDDHSTGHNSTEPDRTHQNATNPTCPDPTGPADQKMAVISYQRPSDGARIRRSRQGHTARWHLILWSLTARGVFRPWHSTLSQR